MADKTFLDWPFFEPPHRELANQLEAWAAKEMAPLEAGAGDDVDAACKEILKRLGAAGWLEYVVPKAFGGRHEAIDVRSLCLIRETLARYSGLADFVFAMQGLGSGTITLFGDQATKKRYLPAVAAGRKCAAFALTEPKAGSDAANLSMTAKDMGDHYILDGQKTLISNGGIADYYTVFARTGEADGAKGISAFLVDADTPGLEVAERIEVMAPHPLARLKFSGVKVPKENLIGKPGEGFKVAMATLDVFRISVAAAALGFAKCGLIKAGKRAKSRKMFGVPMSELQMLQAMLAEMVMDVEASALLIYRAAWKRDVKKVRVTKEAAMAKLFATEAAQRVVDKAVQIWGGMGVVKGQTVEHLYREVRALRIYEGASEVQKIIIARKFLEGLK
ncbi:MAG: acyl-CoA dehydrogenase family protein [Proteobacteria bacterium]|nr:acyl-CoA dehydrogenase family protein [Pseudomonadota bacterium]